MANFFSLKLHMDNNKVINDRGLGNNGRVQQYVDSEVLRLCEPFIPRDIGAGSQGGNLIESGIVNTQIGSGEVKWRTPYARRWYYNVANFQQDGGGRSRVGGVSGTGRGAYWFERMKSMYKSDIVKGAEEIAKGKR